MQYVLGNMLNGGGINPDGLSLDLQFAADKTMTARRGPTPVFTRSSGDNGGTTYFGPLVDFEEATAFSTTGITNGRASWFKSYEGTDITISYTGARWRVVTVDNGDEVIYLAAPGSEWRPDQADWSSQEFLVTTSSTFGIVKAANNEPRFDHTSAGVCRGLLIEEGRTNIVFPSDALATQTRTVTAVAHTLSFYGTGTVVLSGTHSATVVGTGAYPTRTTLTFTPTAGSLTLTITGSVTQAQLEAGSFATSYIPTTTGTLARSADVCSITGGDFNRFYNSTSGTLLSEAVVANLIGNNRGIVQIDNSTNESILRHVYSAGDGGFRSIIRAGGDTATVLSTILGAASTIQKRIIAYEGTSFASVTNGGAVATATRTMSTGLNAMKIGNLADGPFYLSGHIAAIRFYKKRLPNAKIQALTV
jgi:hypothetical protein